MINVAGNDGCKTPTPDPDEGKVVEFLETCTQYRIAHLPTSELRRDNSEQLLMELGVLGAEGWLLVTLTKIPDEEMYVGIFAKTGVKRAKPQEQSKLHVPGKPGGLR